VTVDRGGGATEQQLVKVILLFMASDYRGLAVMVGQACKQSPAAYACFRTWFHGTTLVVCGKKYKTIYGTHAK